jgi:3D (Asp-Asp-Asp) domain-containing protein
MHRLLALLVVVASWGCSGEVTGGLDEADGGGGDAALLPDGPRADAALASDAPAVPDGPITTPDSGVNPGDPGPLLGAYKLTYYYVTDEADYSGDDDTNLYMPGCDLLSVVPAAFSRSVAIEGTGRLDDGRVINYTGSCNCPTSPCYKAVDAAHPWGSGAGNRALKPFRSVAIDRDVLTIGRKYYVEELDGVTMPGPDGFVHDGCVSADDTGGGIDGKHIDFFSALKEYYRTLDGQLRLSTVTLHEGGARCP